LADFGDISFFSKGSVFSRLRKTPDCHMRKLTVEGIGVAVKRADPVSVGDEITFWVVEY